MMKKQTSKLSLRRHTIATLTSTELARAGGGGATIAPVPVLTTTIATPPRSSHPTFTEETDF